MAQTRDGAIKVAAVKCGVSVFQYLAKLKHGHLWCTGCKAWHDYLAFGLDATKNNSIRKGRAATCLHFRGKKQKESYVPRPKISKLGEYFTPTRDGDKGQARSRTNHLIKLGVLPHANVVPCHSCGHIYSAGGRRHEYHHHNGYSTKHQTDVISLCTICHARTHGHHLKKKRGKNGRYIHG